MADSNLNKMIETALENLRKIADVNTIIGEPMSVAGGTTIIPVSKVSMGFTSGGLDYNGKNAADKPANFGGATAAGFNISPVAFLVVDRDGNVSSININSPVSAGSDVVNSVAGLIEKAPSLIDKFKKYFGKEKKAEESSEEAVADAEEENSSSATVYSNDDLDK